MNKWKISFIICLVLLIFSNIFWLYSAIDSGVTYTYQQEMLNQQNIIIEKLGNLIVLGSKDYSKKDILHLLRQADQDAFIVEETNKIIFYDIEFSFEHDVLVKVSK